jgi:tRNA A37 N6-isopentenylltransferase MiaA
VDFSISISDQEKEELKARVLQQAEGRLTQELINEMRREVVRHSLKHVTSFAQKRIEELATATFTGEKIQATLDEAIKKLATETHYPGAYGDTFIKKQVQQAVFNIVNEYARTVSEEMKNLIYTALKHSFFEKKQEEDKKVDG